MLHKLKNLIPQGLKNIYHLLKAVLACFVFGFPSRKMTVIGVTGTNGKTTTVQLIGKVLEEAGCKVALCSTINFKIGEKEQVNKTKFTTLSSWKTQKFISKAAKEDCRYLVMEVSSHALDQNRVWGIDFDTAVFTNLTREHLDYHKNIEKYGKAKEKLFALLKEKRMRAFHHLKKGAPKTAIANLADPLATKLLSRGADLKFGYILKGSTGVGAGEDLTKKIIGKNLHETENGLRFTIDGREVELRLRGKFNAENALAAYCAGLSQGISPENIINGLSQIKQIPGRMERVENDRGLEIVIDYALTPDSMEKLGEMARGWKKSAENKIFWVFGSCGERDRGKRPMMGEIASKFADYIILTNEDPYHEDPERILNEVEAGIQGKKESENFWKILDREEAIKKALQTAKPGDVMLVTGKGAEETMAIGSKTVPWNDKQKIKEILEY